MLMFFGLKSELITVATNLAIFNQKLAIYSRKNLVTLQVKLASMVKVWRRILEPGKKSIKNIEK